MNEVAMPNNAAYGTPGTWEYEAQQVQEKVFDQLGNNNSGNNSCAN
jgi:hypothetical protein